MLKEKHKGDLDLRGGKYMELPQAFELDGDLRLEGSRLLESLPEKLKVTGRLCLDNTQITELPENLEVGNDLNLNYVCLFYVHICLNLVMSLAHSTA